MKKPNQKCDTIDRSRMLAHIPNITTMLELGDSLQWHLQCVKKQNQKCDTIDKECWLTYPISLQCTTKNSQALKKHSAVHRRWQIWILQATGDTMAKKNSCNAKEVDETCGGTFCWKLWHILLTHQLNSLETHYFTSVIRYGDGVIRSTAYDD